MVLTNARDKPIKLLVSAVKAGHPADGFVAAVEECGAILSVHFPPGTLNRDELSNKRLVI
jgi:putative membrane protein